MATRSSRPGRSEQPCDEPRCAPLRPGWHARRQRRKTSGRVPTRVRTSWDRGGPDDLRKRHPWRFERGDREAFLSHLTPERRRAVLDDKEAAYRSDLVDIAPIAGAVALIDFAGRRGMKLAVVTNGPRANAEKVLAALGLELRLPIVVVGSELPRVQTRPSALPEGPGAERAPSRRARSHSRIPPRAFARPRRRVLPWSGSRRLSTPLR